MQAKGIKKRAGFPAYPNRTACDLKSAFAGCAGFRPSRDRITSASMRMSFKISAWAGLSDGANITAEGWILPADFSDS
jgi:hypothetical protein